MRMKFIADEDIAQRIIALLHQAGHGVLDIKRAEKRFSDIEIIRLSEKGRRIIITHDKDFLTLLSNPKFKFKLIFIKVSPPTRENMDKIASFILEKKVWERMKRSAVIKLVGDEIFASSD